MTDIRSFFKPKPDTEQENCQSRVNSLVEAEGQSAKKSPGRIILSFSKYDLYLRFMALFR